MAALKVKDLRSYGNQHADIHKSTRKAMVQKIAKFLDGRALHEGTWPTKIEDDSDRIIEFPISNLNPSLERAKELESKYDMKITGHAPTESYEWDRRGYRSSKPVKCLNIQIKLGLGWLPFLPDRIRQNIRRAENGIYEAKDPREKAEYEERRYGLIKDLQAMGLEYEESAPRECARCHTRDDVHPNRDACRTCMPIIEAVSHLKRQRSVSLEWGWPTRQEVKNDPVFANLHALVDKFNKDYEAEIKAILGDAAK